MYELPGSNVNTVFITPEVVRGEQKPKISLL
jgi:ATP-dependent protease Clp ATPase subunit